MRIIQARRHHIPEIVEIWMEFMEFHRKIDPFFSIRESGPANFEKYLLELTDSRDVQILVAFDKGRAVGYSISKIINYPPIFKHEKHGYISDLAVRGDCRRRGIGEKILNKALKWFESRHMDRIELHVLAANEVGYSFWNKHGFKDYLHKMYLKK
jgi:ribosomal protein S18 acetylase RimI-like enzyme